MFWENIIGNFNEVLWKIAETTVYNNSNSFDPTCMWKELKMHFIKCVKWQCAQSHYDNCPFYKSIYSYTKSRWDYIKQDAACCMYSEEL